MHFFLNTWSYYNSNFFVCYFFLRINEQARNILNTSIYLVGWSSKFNLIVTVVFFFFFGKSKHFLVFFFGISYDGDTILGAGGTFA